MRRVAYAVLFAAVVGCANKKDDAPAAAEPQPRDAAPSAPPKSVDMPKFDTPNPSTPKTAPKPDPLASLPSTLNTRYQDRTAEAWGRELLDTDPRVSGTAGVALNNIGAEGLRYFAVGMGSENENVRYNSVHLAPWTQIAKHRDVFYPILTGLLTDTSGRIRAAAAIKMQFLGWKEALPAMKAARDAEKDAETKKTLAECVSMLEKKK